MIELNGIQISDNNINTKKNVKIYVDEKQLDSKVGELSDLKTTNKSSIVNAINEIKDTTDTLQVDVNRIYSDFTIIPNTPTEQEFTYKKSDEGVIEKGVAVIDKVKGNSVVWNQWEVKQTAENSSEEWYDNNRFWGTNIVSGSLSFNEDSSIISYSFNNNNGFFRGHKSRGYIVGHKYVILVNAKANTRYLNLTNGDDSVTYSGSGNWELMSLFFTAITDTYSNISLRLSNETSFPQAISQSQWKTIDLTQMFGAGNEPSTYEEFLYRKPKIADEYAYNEGTIVNNKVEGVKTTGVNLWDEEWEIGVYRNDNGEKYDSTNRIRSKNPIACTPSTTYYAFYGKSTDQLYAFYYDENMKYITSSPYRVDNRIFTSPSNARFFTLGTYGAETTTYNHDICINLSDPAINGKYFPYEKHELNLSWIKEIKDAEGVKLFEDGLKSVGTAFDEVKAKVATKKFGVVDLGSLSWKRDMLSNGNWAFYNTNAIPSMKYDGSVNMVSVKYQTKELEQAAAGTYEIDQIVFNKPNKQLFIVDKSIEQATDFKAAMQGVKLIYELAEPIIVEYDEKNLTYPVIAGGTEEAIASEPSTPIRASITYGSNTVATILSLINRVNELERKITN